MPDVAPASTDMLHRTRRPEVESRSTVRPENSRTRKFAPCAVRRPTRWRIRSFGPTRSGKVPSTSTRIVDGTSTLTTDPRAHTLAISVAPMPNANAPVSYTHLRAHETDSY